jgi:hypothetical protein
MKTYILLLSSLLISAHASAEMTWAKTNFWQAPYENNYQISFNPESSDLMESCKRMSRSVWDMDGELVIDTPERMQKLRAMPLISQTTDSFLLSVPLWKQASVNLASDQDLINSRNASQKPKLQDTLPAYTQSAAGVYLESNSLSKFQITVSEKSFVGVSRKLGLKDSNVQIKNNSQGLFLEIDGKDLACDLALGSATLTASGKASVRIGIEEHKQLMNFYSGVDQIALKILKEKQIPAQRAALLGFRLGGFLARETVSGPEKSEAHLMEILNHVFELEKMEPNMRWTSSLGEKHLVVNNTSDSVPVQLQISLHTSGE